MTTRRQIVEARSNENALSVFNFHQQVRSRLCQQTLALDAAGFIHIDPANFMHPATLCNSRQASTAQPDSALVMLRRESYQLQFRERRDRMPSSG
jgi:hypothetical protein